VKTINVEKLDAAMAEKQAQARASAEGWSGLNQVMHASGMAVAIAISEVRLAIQESLVEAV
jgi:hypothetical protein